VTPDDSKSLVAKAMSFFAVMFLISIGTCGVEWVVAFFQTPQWLQSLLIFLGIIAIVGIVIAVLGFLITCSVSVVRQLRRKA